MKECKCSEVNGRDTKKLVQLTEEIENNEKLIGKESVELIKNFRKKNPTADLSVYKIEVKEDGE